MREAKVRIENDSDVESPCEYGGFELHSFSHRHSNFKTPAEVGSAM